MFKPGAAMYLGVPIGRDRVAFNAHRFYGKLRFSLLATNWIQVNGDKHPEEDFKSSGILRLGGIGLLFKKVESFHDYSSRH